MTWSGRRRRALSQLVADLRSGRNLEAYGLSLLAFALIAYTVVGNPSQQLFDAVVLACLGFMVLATVAERARHREAQLADVLRDRDSYGSFDQLLDDARELWMYAPSGVNVLLRHSADLRRWVAAGGRARVVVHDPAAGNLDAVRAQLDDNTDFGKDLEASLATLAKLADPERFRYRLLPLNPGFSVVVVNPRHRSGRVILELHGFRADNIGDRMHLEIRRPSWPTGSSTGATASSTSGPPRGDPDPAGRVELTSVPGGGPDHPEARPQ